MQGSEMLKPSKADIIRQANEDHAQDPQFRGHWEGPEWRLVLVRRRISTRKGDAFLKGEITIARSSPRPGFMEAYSLNMKADTEVPARDLLPLMDITELVNIRQKLERVAVTTGSVMVKKACLCLVVEDGTGAEVQHALRYLQRVPFAHGDVEDAVRDIRSLVEAA